MADSRSVEATTPNSPDGDDPLATLSAASDPVRWTVLRRLAAGKACVCDLHEITDVAPNLLSYHLKVLREARLVTATRRGRWVDYELADDALERLHRALPVPDAEVAR